MTNTDQLSGNWKQFKGEVQRQWGKLTDNQLDQIEGSREKLAGQIQESYGVVREEADKQVKAFEEAYCKKSAA